MMDWATKIVEQWAHEIGSAAAAEVVVALRKAKADGMREAAIVAKALEWLPGPKASEQSKAVIIKITSDFGGKISDAILIRAAEIEKGNA